MNKITTLKADDNLRETTGSYKIGSLDNVHFKDCLLYTSDAADD